LFIIKETTTIEMEIQSSSDSPSSEALAEMLSVQASSGDPILAEGGLEIELVSIISDGAIVEPAVAAAAALSVGATVGIAIGIAAVVIGIVAGSVVAIKRYRSHGSEKEETQDIPAVLVTSESQPAVELSPGINIYHGRNQSITGRTPPIKV
jgi:hypothetical protein